MPKKPKKREWDTSTPGRPPALRELKPGEQELKDALASAGAVYMSADEKMLAHAAASLETYDANLRFYLGPDYMGEDKAERVKYFRHAVAGALGDLGRFDEALSVLTGKNGQALPGCAKAVHHLIQVADAVDRDDDEECGCERPQADVPKTIIFQSLRSRVKASDPTVTVALNRRYSIGKIYSATHGKIVDVLRCQKCGFLNATDQIPERQSQIEELRMENDAMIRTLLESGMPLKKIDARFWTGKNGPGFHVEQSDNTLLAD
jgi:hypothetical protein